MKSGILLVAYGSGNLRGAATLRAVQAAAESRFGLPVRWAFTSETMRLRLARSRTKSDSVLKALNRMRFERYTHVAVQTLHVIPGMEYEGVAADCRIAGEGSLSVSLGAPLLSESGQSESALSAAASALLRHISPLRAAGEPVVCMAHGSRHECDVLYSRMAEKVRSLDPFIHVACMVGRGIPRRPPRKPPHSPAAPRQAETHPDGLDLLLPLLTADSLSPAECGCCLCFLWWDDIPLRIWRGPRLTHGKAAWNMQASNAEPNCGGWPMIRSSSNSGWTGWKPRSPGSTRPQPCTPLPPTERAHSRTGHQWMGNLRFQARVPRRQTTFQS